MEYTISKEAYEGDIVSRLRNWRGLHLAHGGRLFDEAAGEIERLRGDLEVRRLQLDAAAGEVEKLHSRLRLADAALRSESPTLTDAEREAIANACLLGTFTDEVTTLRRLLERTRD
jgi:hypothetical protein